MKISFDKKQIIYYLFGLSVLFLIANIVQVKISKKTKKTRIGVIHADTVNIKFLKDLSDFGLKHEWIKSARKRGRFTGNYNYSVDVPKDLPITVILEEVYGTFYGSGLDLSSKELVIGGKTFLKISNEDDDILTAEFNYSDKIERDAGSAGLIITGLNDAGEKVKNELAGFPQTFAALLVPSKKSIGLADELTENRKEFAVLINDDISEINYKLSPGYSAGRLRNSIRAIIAAFPKAIFFMIDDRSSLYISPVFPFIRDEFKKRKITLLRESKVVGLKGNSTEQIDKEFRSMITPLKDGQNKLIRVSVEDFKMIMPEILGLIKIGYKFINPSLIAKTAGNNGQSAK